MNHQIDQLKEEISAKENALVKERLDHQDVEKHKEQLKVSFVNFKLSTCAKLNLVLTYYRYIKIPFVFTYQLLQFKQCGNV